VLAPTKDGVKRSETAVDSFQVIQTPFGTLIPLSAIPLSAVAKTAQSGYNEYKSLSLNSSTEQS